jgi:hypothetical protein
MYIAITSAPQVGKVSVRKYERFSRPEDKDHNGDGGFKSMCLASVQNFSVLVNRNPQTSGKFG